MADTDGIKCRQQFAVPFKGAIPCRKKTLTYPLAFRTESQFQAPLRKGLKGNLVQIRDGPAAVIGDERCKTVTGF